MCYDILKERMMKMYCNKCGNVVKNGDKYCSSCGQALVTGMFQDRSINNMYNLKIVRSNDFYIVNPAVKVVIDGAQEYRVENGNTIDIPISSGVHNIVFSASLRKNNLNINVDSNAVIYVEWDRITGRLQANYSKLP